MYKEYGKRLLDIVVSFILIIVLSPLFLLTMILVLFSLGTPIIFKQTREGKDRKSFTIYKFRTMNFDESLSRYERMTNITRVLDMLKLNELPQLFNVLKGDMSLIGPRPFIPGNIVALGLKNKRYNMKPGITGYAQINGGRFIPKSKKIKYDSIYVDKVSFLMDLKILLLTPFRMLKYK